MKFSSLWLFSGRLFFSCQDNHDGLKCYLDKSLDNNEKTYHRLFMSLERNGERNEDNYVRSPRGR